MDQMTVEYIDFLLAMVREIVHFVHPLLRNVSEQRKGNLVMIGI